ncbi:MAG: membrane protein insertase YidC [Kiritimatiellae bacterium]|nr:membrane protein insertase YidC [Kiritimatiellia bacterium]
MNKQERVLAAVLGIALVAWMFYSNKTAAQRAKERAAEPQADVAVQTAETQPAELKAAVNDTTAEHQSGGDALPPAPAVEEQVMELTSDAMKLEVSSHGAVLKSATLSGYNTFTGKAGPENPPVKLDFSEAPGLQLVGVAGLAPNAAYDAELGSDNKTVTLKSVTDDRLIVTRTIEMQDDYRVKVTDTLRNAGEKVLTLGTNSVSVGVMSRGESKNDTLSVDSLPAFDKAKVRYWDKEKVTKQFLSGASGGFGCGGKPSALGLPESISVPIAEPQNWVAIKSRFFVTGFSSSEDNSGFTVRVARDTAKPVYTLNNVSARVFYPGRVLGQGEAFSREYTLYVGPKKLSLLQAMGNGMDGVMQFGFFTWFCKLLVPTLNFFHRVIPNYGVAIILLTFLVRIIFWPLTHHSTKSMKKMQEIQPLLKELQVKFKGNPQKLQQETWAIYRENKVNPMSSCLPMLIQIPVFIALFTVLRSAVELRYAPFLWISDLSEPENLFAGMLPIPLNILPVLMSATMALQSYLTPSAGDPQQQKMMMVMMPIMMLFMFYSFPSALSLYWTVSQVVSIVQMWMMRRNSAQKAVAAGVAVEMPMTRQQRRHGAKG